MSEEMKPAPGDARPGPPAIIWAMTLIFVAFELAFQAASAGILPFGDLRWEVYKKLAFFDLYFEGMLEGYEVPFEFWTSFLTHAVLHGGLVHLAMNGAIFLGLGGMIANNIGAKRFLVLFVVTAIAGSLTFALITDTQGPLVGASGAIFGFFGALKRWEWRWLTSRNMSLSRFWGSIAGLTALNVLLALFFPGEGAVAWEAHLGGFVAGFLIAPVLAPGRGGPSPI
ncbi:MAG: rhomboid family intramembrane serine protease [Pseudomonadota bacterium]